MKRFLYCALALSLLTMITGCIESTKEYSCVKKMTRISGSNFHSETKVTAKVNDSNKLRNYKTVTTYTYDTKKMCEESCKTSKKWNNDKTEKKYSGVKRSTTCNCKKNIVEETDEYDIKKLDKKVRSDIDYLSKDDTFDLDKWIKESENNGYKCEK